MTSTADREHFEQRLKQRARQLRVEIRDALRRAGNERFADLADRVDDAQDLALAEALAEVTHADVRRDAEEIQDIRAALQRLAAGTFGRCIDCGTSIPRARLDAYPTAKRCLSCQQAHENATGRSSTPAA